MNKRLFKKAFYISSISYVVASIIVKVNFFPILFMLTPCFYVMFSEMEKGSSSSTTKVKSGVTAVIALFALGFLILGLENLTGHDILEPLLRPKFFVELFNW